MPRSIILSNGKLFAGIDSRLRIRDLCYPGTGGSNHLNGRSIRLGIWVENELKWLDSEEFEIDFSPDSFGNVSKATARHAFKAIEIHLEFLLNPENSMIAISAEFPVSNCSALVEQLFVTEQLCINESDIGDTAMFHAPSHSILHFKGDVGFAFFGATETNGIYSYSCGIKDFGGAEGTFRDAEDGVLSGNPIAQGSVDSTFSIDLSTGESQTRKAWVVILPVEGPLGKRCNLKPISFADCEALRTAALAENRTNWVQLQNFFDRVPDDISRLAIQSVPMLLAHCDTGGAIIAAVDSDIMQTNRAHYRYCWMRDGANVAELLLDLDLDKPAERFLDFCHKVFDPENPAFLQKYTASGQVGATWHPWLSCDPKFRPIQEDETASVVTLLCKMIAKQPAVQAKFELMLERMVEFLIADVDPDSALPLPSYDLWEERFGIHAYTVSAVITALQRAETLLATCNPNLTNAAKNCRESMQTAMLQTFFSTEGICRTLSSDGHKDFTVDSSLLCLLLDNSIDPNSEIAKQLFELIQSKLACASVENLFGRYENDYYFRVPEQDCGNPWIITSLWVAQVHILRAKVESDLEPVLQILNTILSLAEKTGVLAEQYHLQTREPLSVSPLTWSHAELVRTCLMLQSWLESQDRASR